MTIDERWDDLTSGEKDLFQKCCRRLLKHTFIVREKDDDHKKMYYFVSKNVEFISEYFQFMAFDIVVDRENGVVMLKNFSKSDEVGKLQVNRLQLKKAESIVLCTLWTLYADRMRSGSLAQKIIVGITDLRYALEKYGANEKIEKTLLSEILPLLAKYNLVSVIGKVGEPDCMIQLYPSLQFALESEEFKRFAENTEKRMLDKGGAEEDDFEFDED